MSQEQPRIADEMVRMRHEPLLPIEKKLISWSLGLGIVLLVLLAIISRIWI